AVHEPFDSGPVPRCLSAPQGSSFSVNIKRALLVSAIVQCLGQAIKEAGSNGGVSSRHGGPELFHGCQIWIVGGECLDHCQREPRLSLASISRQGGAEEALSFREITYFSSERALQ